jgi:hypothetical protein
MSFVSWLARIPRATAAIFGLVKVDGTTITATAGVIAAAADASKAAGPASATAGHIATYADNTGKVLADGGAIPTGDVVGPASNTADSIPQWNGTNSKTLKDGLVVGTGAGNLVQLIGGGMNPVTLPAVDGSLLTNLPSSGPEIHAGVVQLNGSGVASVGVNWVGSSTWILTLSYQFANYPTTLITGGGILSGQVLGGAYNAIIINSSDVTDANWVAWTAVKANP